MFCYFLKKKKAYKDTHTIYKHKDIHKDIQKRN